MQDLITHKNDNPLTLYENDTLLNAIGYFNVDHELE